MKTLRKLINNITNKFNTFISKRLRRGITSFAAYNIKGSHRKKNHILINEHTALVDLAPGEEGVVKALFVNDNIKSRLNDIGLVEGTIIRCLGDSPLGDPKSFLIRGAVIALRCDDCKNILITQARASSDCYR